MSTAVLIYELKISLKGTSIWRKIRIPEHFSFAQLHAAICQSFNWKKVLQHRFKCPLGNISDEHSIAEIFDEMMNVAEYIIYNSVEHWLHDILFERRIQFRSININQTHAVCISGRWARPPEKCGGLDKFNVIREIFADKTHRDFDSVSFFISNLDAADADWTKMDDSKIGPITLNV